MRDREQRPEAGIVSAVMRQMPQRDAGKARLEGDTVWLRQEQLSQLFGRDRTVIGRHVRNVFEERELARGTNVQDLHIASSDKPISLKEREVKALFRDAEKGERSRPGSVRADSAHTAEVRDSGEVKHEALPSTSAIRRSHNVLAALGECGQ